MTEVEVEVEVENINYIAYEKHFFNNITYFFTYILQKRTSSISDYKT
jgi:hypothetical protein